MVAGRSVAGLILAAGTGRRYGGPKALDFLGPAIGMLRAGGCAPVVVVLGAGAEQVLQQVDLAGAVVVTNADWACGMASSLRLGLAAVAETGAEAACVHLVDMPGVTASAVARLLTAGRLTPTAVLARASYHGEPGHPVLLGRDHWAPIARTLTGDQGARAYLRARAAEVITVECADVAAGFDIDVKETLPADVSDATAAPETDPPDRRNG